jgi:hypothetical protein
MPIGDGGVSNETSRLVDRHETTVAMIGVVRISSP